MRIAKHKVKRISFAGSQDISSAENLKDVLDELGNEILELDIRFEKILVLDESFVK